MGWGRLDDSFDDNPKIVALMAEEDGLAAIGLWTCCLAWAHRNTRGGRGRALGYIPAGLPRRYGSTAGKHLADLLVLYGLWELADNEGWLIHDFIDYLTVEEMARVTDSVTLRCENCHTDLGPGRRDRRFCSHACRSAEHRRRKIVAAQDCSDTDTVTHPVTEKRHARDVSRDVSNGKTTPPEPEPITTEPSPTETVLRGDKSMKKRRASNPGAEDETTQTILAGWIDHCASKDVKLPSRLRGQYAKTIKEVLNDGFDPKMIKHVLAKMLVDGVANRPSLLPNRLVAHQTGPERAPARISTTDQRVAAGLALAEQLREQEQAQITDGASR